MQFLIRCPDQQTTMALDLDAENTTIVTIQALVADEIKAEWRSLGLRVLRDTLLAEGVTLRFGDRELRPEETLAECGIREGSEVQATIRRTDDGTGLMRTRAHEGKEMEERRNRRKRAKKPKERKEVHKATDLPPEEADTGNEEEDARRAEEQLAEETKVLNEELAVMEDDLREIEERDEQELEEARQAGRFRIGAEIPDEAVVEVAEQDPFDDEDGDKENWNPQILRNVGRNQGGLQTS